MSVTRSPPLCGELLGLVLLDLDSPTWPAISAEAVSPSSLLLGHNPCDAVHSCASDDVLGTVFALPSTPLSPSLPCKGEEISGEGSTSTASVAGIERVVSMERCAFRSLRLLHFACVSFRVPCDPGPRPLSPLSPFASKGHVSLLCYRDATSNIFAVDEACSAVLNCYYQFDYNALIFVAVCVVHIACCYEYSFVLPVSLRMCFPS